jgi:hypothetical protein
MARYRPTAAETRAYETFARDHERPYCWLCGRGERDKPADWHAPWIISRAHVVNSPRVEAPQFVVLMCPRCHGASHGERHQNPDCSYASGKAPFPEWVLAASSRSSPATSSDRTQPKSEREIDLDPYYLPPVSRANLLWLKLTFDPARYSEKLLQSCCVGRLPSPEPPAEFYLECHRQRRPENARLIEQMLEF